MAFKKGLQMRPEKRRAFMRQRYEHALDRLHESIAEASGRDCDDVAWADHCVRTYLGSALWLLRNFPDDVRA